MLVELILWLYFHSPVAVLNLSEASNCFHAS